MSCQAYDTALTTDVTQSLNLLAVASDQAPSKRPADLFMPSVSWHDNIQHSRIIIHDHIFNFVGKRVV